MAMKKALFVFLTLGCFLSIGLYAHPKKDKRGVDPKVDYRSLDEYGPWDDRNYGLTAADLQLLAPNERDLKEPLPAFFRVLMRRNSPELPREGPAQYPRSALQIFHQTCGGYLIDGKIYRTVRLENGHYLVVKENGHSFDPEQYPSCRLDKP